MRAPLIVLALLAVAGSAAAGEARLDLPAEPVAPKGEAVAGALRLDLPCESLPSARPETVSLVAEEVPSWAQVEFTPATLPAARAACVDGVWSGRAEVAVKVSQDAPALKPAALRVAAIRESGERIVAAGTFQAAWFGLIDLRADETRRAAPAGSPVSFPITATNFGNGLTRVTFAVTGAPPGWSVAVPPSLALESRQEGGDRSAASFALGVAVPAGASGEQTLRLAYTVAHALKPGLNGEGGSLELTVDATGRSVPAAGFLAGLAGLVAVAAALRRR